MFRKDSVKNHKHLKPCHLINPSIIPSPSMPLPVHTDTTSPKQLIEANTQLNPNIIHENLIATAPAKTPRALKSIADYNAPGLLEQNPSLP